MKTVGLCLLVFIFAAGVSAQTIDAGWRNLDQLKPGDRIEVVLKNKAKHGGTFAMLADDAITVRTASGDSGFPRAEVARVSRVGQARRGRAALIGLAIGAAAGAGIGAAAGTSSTGDWFDLNNGATAAVGAVLFGGIGAGVGAAVARPSKTDLYRAP